MDPADSAVSADVLPSMPPAVAAASSTMATLQPTVTEETLPPAHSSPITPAPTSQSKAGRVSPRPAAATTPRISSRARKPSAKVAEMAEAGPSGTSGASFEEEMKPKPRFLQPDHFSALNNGAKPPCGGRTRWEPVYAEDTSLSPEDDPLALRGIPVFRPTMEEFQDFEGYINKTAPWGMRSGIAKIIPPQEWTDNLPKMNTRTLSRVHIKSPIQQNMMGTAGIFRAQNIEKNKTRPLSVKEWFEKCQNEKFAGPSPKVVERDSREAAVAREEAMREKKEKWAKKKEGKLRRREERAAEEESAKVEEEEPKVEPQSGDVDMAEEAAERTDSLPGLDAPSSGSSHSSPGAPKTPEEEPLDEWYESTNLNTAWLPKNTKAEDYTTEGCVRLAEKYWKTMGLGEPSWYGADLMQGSLFADKKTPWNVAHLPNLLDRINCVVPGVNEPYLYFGMWRATFAWHVEDMDLFSINFIHFGAPKFWYAIPQAQAEHFERFMAGEFPLDARECDQFIRHKSMAISPTRLKDAQTRVNMLVHNQGEFVITYPRGYHAGFNLGFNCAESVNFATDDWVDYGRKAKVCKCVNFSVRIDVDTMLTEAEDLVQQERDDPGLKRALAESEAAEEDVSSKTPRKRARKSKLNPILAIEDPQMEITSEMAHVDDLAPLMTSTPMPTPTGTTPVKAKKQPKIAPRKVVPVKEKPVYRCLFCPSLSTIDLCPVYEPNDFVKAQWKGVAAEPIAVHLMCAQSTPECYFHEEAIDGVETIWVMGVNDVVRDRWTALKCKLCPDKARAASGVKVQCTKGKCPAAFHYSCAKADEHLKTELWQVEEWLPVPIPDDAPPGTQPTLEKVSNVKLELLCATHNPAQKEIREREKAEELRQRILQFAPGSIIKIKSGSGSCEYKLVAIHDEEKSVELEVRAGQTIKAAWARVDFRSATATKMVENEYARHHVTSRKADAPSAPAQAHVPHPIHITHPPPSGPSRIIHPPPSSSSNLHPQHAMTMASMRPSQSQSATNLFPYLTAQTTHPLTVVTRSPAPPPPHQSHLPKVGSWPPDNRQHVHPPPLYPVQNHHPGSTSAYVSFPHPSYMSQVPAPLQPHGAYSQVSPSYLQPYTPQQHIQTLPLQYLPPGYGHPHTQLYTSREPAYHAYPQSSIPPDPRIYAQSHRYQPDIAVRRMSAQSHMSTDSPSAPSGMQHLLNPATIGASANVVPNNGQASTSTSPGINQGSVGKIDLGLERMHRLMATIGRIETPAIHIAGTNGKGSVSAIIESILRVAGFQTARYNSPHLLEPRDAVRLNGRPVNADAYYRAIAHFEQVSTQLGINATSFEITTVAAYALMAEFKPDIMIIECGMGGARDATNVIPPDLVLATVLTPVGLDHTAFLGDTVEAIAEEKSNIAVKGALFVIARQPIEAAVTTAHAVAKARGAQAYDAYRTVAGSGQTPSATSYGSFVRPAPQPVTFHMEGMLDLAGKLVQSASIEMHIPLPGAHQINNASTAVTLLHRLRYHPRATQILPPLSGITVTHIQQGLERTKWAGRCSWLEHRDPASGLPPILVDGAHNADSATSLRAYIDSCLPNGGGPVTFIVSLSDSKGKAPQSVLQPLFRPGDKVAAVEFSGPVEGMPWVKSVPKAIVSGIAEGLVGKDGVWVGQSGEAGSAEPMAGLMSALTWAREQGGLTVICGSLYLVADACRVLGTAGYQ